MCLGRVSFDGNLASVVVVIVDSDGGVIFWEDVFDGTAPFYDDDLIVVGEFFFEVFYHDARVIETIKVVVGEGFAVFACIGF